jgi:plastocyanin
VKRIALIATALALFGCGESRPAEGDGFVGACSAVVNGCAAADFVPATGGPVTIVFGVSGDTYDPKCVDVTAGQPITFQGSFSLHPLSQTCGPVDAIPATSAGTTLTITPPAGTYGYRCNVHGAAGMVGAIRVVP